MEHGVLVVNFAALQQAGADIQRALSTLESQLGQLERDAAPLVASWNGAAREAYEVRQSAQWTPGIASGTSVFTYLRSPRITRAIIVRSCTPCSADATMSYQVGRRPHFGQSGSSPLTHSGAPMLRAGMFSSFSSRRTSASGVVQRCRPGSDAGES